MERAINSQPLVSLVLEPQENNIRYSRTTSSAGLVRVHIDMRILSEMSAGTVILTTGLKCLASSPDVQDLLSDYSELLFCGMKELHQIRVQPFVKSLQMIRTVSHYSFTSRFDTGIICA